MWEYRHTRFSLCPLSFFYFEMHQVKDLCYYWIGFDYVFVHPFSSVFFFLVLLLYIFILRFLVSTLSCVQVQASKHTECFICCCCCWCCCCYDMNWKVYLIVASIVFKTMYAMYILPALTLVSIKWWLSPKLKSGQHLSVNVLLYINRVWSKCNRNTC